MQIEQLQLEAQLAYDRELAKRNIKQQMESRLTVAHNGGLFRVTPELILFLFHYHNQGDTNLTILDSYENPVTVGLLELYTLCSQRYKEVMNEWSELKDQNNRIRSAKDV